LTETVVVEDVLSAGRFGGAIFRASRANGSSIRIVASRTVMPQVPINGEIWSVGGRVKRHPQYGPQVIADTAWRERPSGRVIIQHLEKSPAFPGIGRARAKALWDAFGEGLYALLDSGEARQLSEVIGEGLAEVLVRGWTKEAALGPVLKWLDQHGFPLWLARKVVSIWGASAEAKLQENPYRMLAFASWQVTDRAGLAAGVAVHDERRLIAAVEACCYHRLASGHTRVTPKLLASMVSKLLGCRAAIAAAAINAAVKDRAIVKLRGHYQPFGPWAMERHVADATRVMVTGGSVSAQPALSRPLTSNEFDKAIRTFERNEGYRLNREQREAVHMALTSALSVICGGAGVGKTTTLKALHDVHERLGGKAYQMALSGRAAMRMAEATERPAKTIAGFLNAVREGKIDLGLDPLIIIDEASMIDLPTMYRLHRCLQPGCRLLLVGDPGQLPPIGFGIAFHALAASGNVPLVELVEVHRQAASTGIPGAAATIRGGEVPALNAYTGKKPGVSFIDAPAEEIAGILVETVAELGGFDEVQIVGATKRGPAGIMALNTTFHEVLTPGRPEHFGFCPGEPVIWLVNDWDAGILNGSLGTVVRGEEDGLVIDFEDEEKSIAASRIEDLALAYAITTHKAQGSQFRRVLVPIVASRLLDRTLLYTAMTRAQEQVVFVGDIGAFHRAIVAEPTVALRDVGMHEHLAIIAA
jgi:exodeoxyribonuclease V alpha subunit